MTLRFGYWLPVFGGWLRNVEDEGMPATWEYVRDLAVTKAFKHDEQQCDALIVHQRGERAFDVASAPFRSRRVGCVGILDLRQRGAARQRAQAIAIQIGQNRVEPTPDIAAMKQMLRP